MGGLDGADDLCQGLADDAALVGTFRAWLGDGVEGPVDRFTQSPSPYILTTGTIIADNWTDLVDGSLDAPIDVTETGGVPPMGNTTCGGSTVWTNVNTDGTTNSAHCDGWTNSAGTAARWGYSSASDGGWTAQCSGGGAVCVWVSPIYCFQQ
jgi:hypothetical protein